MNKAVLAALVVILSSGVCAAGPTLEDLHGPDWDIPAQALARVRSAPLRLSGGKPAPAAQSSAGLSSLRRCEAALAETITWIPPVFRDGYGTIFLGFAAAAYSESAAMKVSLVLVTDAAAYYYYESCDICAEVDRVDLKTHAVTKVLQGHAVGCGDMLPFVQGRIIYDSCKTERRD